MSGGGDEDRKPNTGGDHINLKVKGQEGTATIQDLVGRVKHLELDEKINQGCNEVHFCIKRSTQLEKLMHAYCERQSVELNSIDFVFNGLRLRGEQTPDELEMEEGDEISALPRLGGGRVGDEIEKPNTGDPGALVNLKVKGQDGSEIFFRIRRGTQLKKLMDAYCAWKSVELNLIVFLFNGRYIQGEHTAHELEMKECDEIYAMHRLTGGA